MYINAKVVNRQFELVCIHLGLFLPVNQTRTEKSLGAFHYFVQTHISHSFPGRTVVNTAGGETQSSYPCPLSLTAALDISHQSRPNRGGAC